MHSDVFLSSRIRLAAELCVFSLSKPTLVGAVVEKLGMSQPTISEAPEVLLVMQMWSPVTVEGSVASTPEPGCIRHRDRVDQRDRSDCTSVQ